MNPILELKIQGYFPTALLVSQNGVRLARVMIAVMKEKDDFSPNLLLQTAGRQNLSEQESLGKKSARLLAETNNRVMHRSKEPSYPIGSFSIAKDSLLQERRQNQHGRASNKSVPENTNIRRCDEDE